MRTWVQRRVVGSATLTCTVTMPASHPRRPHGGHGTLLFSCSPHTHTDAPRAVGGGGLRASLRCMWLRNTRYPMYLVSGISAYARVDESLTETHFISLVTEGRLFPKKMANQNLGAPLSGQPI